MYEQQIERLPMTVADIQKILEEYAEKRKDFKYAFVIHDKDVTKEGKPVEPHLHVMAQLGVGQHAGTVGGDVQRQCTASHQLAWAI